MSSRTLVFTLGRGFRQQGTSRYRTATYRFSDGTVSAPSAFFGLSLLKWLRDPLGVPPDKVVVLGTRSSIWDALLETNDEALNEQAMDLAAALGERVSAGSVDDACLLSLTDWLNASEGVPFLLRVVPEGLDHPGQMETLRILSEAVPPRAELHMCVTHGLRHMPMLQMLSIFHLAQTSGVRLAGLYYGALEMGNNGQSCPVVELTGAADIQKWSLALHTVAATGRLEPLADAAARDAPAIAAALRATDYRLAINQVGLAALSARQAGNLIQTDGLPGSGQLFEKAAIARLTWASQGTLWEKQRLCARHALEAGDLMHCSILCFEAFISKALPAAAHERDYGMRKSAYESLLDSLAWKERGDLRTLEHLRNAIAHGSATQDPDVRDLLEVPGNLKAFLEKMLRRLGQ